MNYGHITHRVFDDSYVITKAGLPYHVYPYAAEFAELWDEVFAYAEAHPEMVTEEQPYVPPVPTLEEAKATKLAAINTAADKAIAALTATYPDREIATFDKQEAEARAYSVDPTAPTPLLSALSKARGVPLDECVRDGGRGAGPCRHDHHAGRGGGCMTYGKKVLIALDQLCNTLVGGWPDETLSSRCWRWSRDGVRDWPRCLVDGLPFWKAGHCLRAYEGERKRLQCPPELREG